MRGRRSDGRRVVTVGPIARARAGGRTRGCRIFIGLSGAVGRRRSLGGGEFLARFGLGREPRTAGGLPRGNRGRLGAGVVGLVLTTKTHDQGEVVMCCERVVEREHRGDEMAARTHVMTRGQIAVSGAQRPQPAERVAATSLACGVGRLGIGFHYHLQPGRQRQPYFLPMHVLSM